MAGQARAGHRVFALIAAVLACVLIARGIYILGVGQYTAAPRFTPAAHVTGGAAILYGASSTASGAAFAGSLLYLLWDRARLALIVGGGFGLIAVVLLFASLFAE